MNTALGIISYLLTILTWIIIIQFVLSILIAFNVVNTYNEFIRNFAAALDKLTEPLYRPIRRILPDFGAIDFAPMVVLILITIVQRFLIPAMVQPVVYIG